LEPVSTLPQPSTSITAILFCAGSRGAAPRLASPPSRSASRTHTRTRTHARTHTLPLPFPLRLQPPLRERGTTSDDHPPSSHQLRRPIYATLVIVYTDLKPLMGNNTIFPGNRIHTVCTLLDLETELLVEILAYLPPADMASVQRTCRTIRDIVAGTSYLQYILHAKINCVDDLLPPNFPHHERLKLLRRHEQSWRDLQFYLFTESHSISDRQSPHFFTLQGGHLIYQCLPGRERGLQYGYTDLCSAERNEELRWVHLTMGESQYSNSTTIVFAVDHDLLVAVRFCVLFYPFPECKHD
jgi:hypothetical protein